ncbi:hypothetical protein KQI41_01005 [Tissierella pigra]|uniref:hypothetical protein n=1 Tax=Tissierella pigra TaxID=2607614 RepID=UPI001C125AA8|nr:hypothetical protein [Tissierella pigra]MBU5424973.1 hypothetical protein [Tissierella pigra]
MKLHETIYMKITDKDKIYYLLYKSYADDQDGSIDVEEINKRKFEFAKESEFKIEEKTFDNARFGIKRRIQQNEFEGVKYEVS